MRELSEKTLAAELHKFIDEGAAARRDGAPCPYAGNTVAHMLHASGWLKEDLRIALIKADPDGYGKDQISRDPSLEYLVAGLAI